MKMTPLFGGVLLLAACGGLVLTHGAVIELDDNSFYNYAKDRDVLLVDFYAPWCSDCKNLEPDFQAAGVSLGARSIDLAKVDCFGAGKGLCTKYGVKQWPTLKNFNRGTYTGDYTGGLSSGEIAGYVNTVENSVSSQVISNPYAAPYTPMVMQTQQCVSRCKISKITNKAPCYAKCKAPKPAVRKMLPQPVINEKSCAKCRQPQIAGKFSGLKMKNSGKAISKRYDVKKGNKTTGARSLFIDVRVRHGESDLSLAGDVTNVLKWASEGISSRVASAQHLVSGIENHEIEQNVDVHVLTNAQDTTEKRSNNMAQERKSQTEVLEVIQDRKGREPKLNASKKLVIEEPAGLPEQANQTSVVEVIGVTKNMLGVRDAEALKGLMKHKTFIPGEIAYATVGYKRTLSPHTHVQNGRKKTSRCI